MVHLEKRVDDSIRNIKSTLFLCLNQARRSLIGDIDHNSNPPLSDPKNDRKPGGKCQDAGQDISSRGHSGEHLNE